MTEDDALYRLRLRALAPAAELGNVRSARKAMGCTRRRSTGEEARCSGSGRRSSEPRERRRPKTANQTSPFLEQRVAGLRPRQPGFGSDWISAEHSASRGVSRRGTTTSVRRMTRPRSYLYITLPCSPPSGIRRPGFLPRSPPRCRPAHPRWSSGRRRTNWLTSRPCVVGVITVAKCRCGHLLPPNGKPRLR